MKFEAHPEDSKYEYRITFGKGDEAEALGAAYREQVIDRMIDEKVEAKDRREKIKQHELDFSEFREDEPRTIGIDNPEGVATVLESFFKRTNEQLIRIAWGVEVPFKSDDIARRIKLAETAQELAKLIRDEFRVDELSTEIDEHGPALFTNPSDSLPENPGT